MAKVAERTYAADKQRVWDALRGIVEARSWTIEAEDPVAGGLMFNTGRSTWSHWGQDMVVTLNEQNGGTQVLIGGRLVKSAPSDDEVIDLAGGYRIGYQLFSSGEKGRIVKKIYADLDRALGVPGSPAPR